MPTVKQNRAIKYRAYPTEEQEVLLAKTFGCVRFVWNHMLMDAQQFLNEAGTFLSLRLLSTKRNFRFLKKWIAVLCVTHSLTYRMLITVIWKVLKLLALPDLKVSVKAKCLIQRTSIRTKQKMVVLYILLHSAMRQ